MKTSKFFQILFSIIFITTISACDGGSSQEDSYIAPDEDAYVEDTAEPDTDVTVSEDETGIDDSAEIGTDVDSDVWTEDKIQAEIDRVTEKYSWFMVTWTCEYNEESFPFVADAHFEEGYFKPCPGSSISEGIFTGVCFRCKNGDCFFGSYEEFGYTGFPSDLPDGKLRWLPFLKDATEPQDFFQPTDPGSKFFLTFEDMPTFDPASGTGIFYYPGSQGEKEGKMRVDCYIK